MMSSAKNTALGTTATWFQKKSDQQNAKTLVYAACTALCSKKAEMPLKEGLDQQQSDSDRTMVTGGGCNK